MCNIPCKGYCCRRFYLPFSPRELSEMANGLRRHSFNQAEIDKINSMVVYLGIDRLDANREPNQSGKEGHWYTCKNLDTKTGLCMDYENRPRMCYEFPYDKPCEYHKCSSHPWWRHYKVTRWIRSFFPKKQTELERLRNEVKKISKKNKSSQQYLKVVDSECEAVVD